MKRKFQWIVLCGFLVALSGCVSAMPERTKATGISLEKVPTAIASVEKAEVSIEDGRLVVTGTLRRMHEVKLPGHVDVALCGPEGVLERKSVPVPGLSSKKRGAMNLLFVTHFDRVPPPGSKVRVRYHAPPFENETILKCG